MPYSIQLRFDEESESRILSLSEKLNDFGIPDPRKSHKSLPHIALGVFQDLDIGKAKSFLEEVEFKDIPLIFSFLATFSGTENVIFLGPMKEQKLYDLHKRVFSEVSRFSKYDNYYGEEFWIPHCTVGIDIPEEHFGKAFQHIKKNFSPFSGRCERLCITKFKPSEVIYIRKLRK